MGRQEMNVIHGEENKVLIEDKYTILELETFFVKEDVDPVCNYAIIGPGDIPFANFIRLSQFLPVHEALMKNYKEQNWDFCIQAIGHLKGNIDPFMDTFYDILASRVVEQQTNPTENWSPILNVS